MQDLKILQQQFKKAIVNEEENGESLPILENGLTKKLRLSIYQEGYYLRLIDCLSEDFPETLEKIKESEDFIKTFLRKKPSTYTNPAEYSKDFADYIAKEKPELAELAQMEWQKCLSLYSPEAQSLNTQEIAKLPPEELLRSQFHLHPSLRLVQVGKQHYVLFRYQNKVHAETISQEKNGILAKLLQKKSIEEIIEMHSEQNETETLIFETFSFLAAKGLITGRTSC